MCYRRVRKAQFKHRKTKISKQGRQTHISKMMERRDDHDFFLESIREWVHQEQLRSILIFTKL